MSKLIINRTSEWNNKARAFEIYLNGKKIGVIDDGERKEFEIDAGNHNINGKIDWCKSKKMKFEIAENESKELEISGFKYGPLVISISIGSLLVYLLAIIFFKTKLPFLMYFSVLLFLYPVYFITLGKNRYLRIKEI